MTDITDEDRARARSFLYPDATMRYSSVDELATAFAQARRAGIVEGLRMGADECVQLWKDAPNTREDGYRQNWISHGCVECRNHLRALADKREEDDDDH